MLSWCSVQLKDNPIAHEADGIIDYREWKQEQTDKDPALVDDGVL